MKSYQIDFTSTCYRPMIKFIISKHTEMVQKFDEELILRSMLHSCVGRMMSKYNVRITAKCVINSVILGKRKPRQFDPEIRDIAIEASTTFKVKDMHHKIKTELKVRHFLI